MKKSKDILVIVAFLMISAGILNGQQVVVIADTAAFSSDENKVREQEQIQKQEQKQTLKQEQKQEQEQKQTLKQEQDKTQAKVQSQKGNASGVKQVHGAKPDWSKGRGARPPSVERPSGSRIPKGAGKPHGAKGPVGR